MAGEENMWAVGTMGRMNEYKLGDNWSIYFERLQLYFEVNGVPEARRVPLLLTLIGTEAYTTLRDLCDPELPQEKSLEYLSSLLGRQFTPKVSVFRKRIEFLKLEQESEGVQDWFVRVKKVAKECEFGAMLDEWVKNKFVTGLKPGHILDRLCEEKPTQKLEQLLEIASSREASNRQEISTINKVVTYMNKGLPNDGKPKVESISENISISTSNLDYDQPQAQYCLLNVIIDQQEIASPSVLPTLQGNSVFKLLEDTDEGKLIKSTYGPFKKFRRSHLCNLITKHELQKSSDNRITTERFKILAQEINEIFTHEDAAIYYSPYIKGANGKVVAASGKLWSVYVHQRKILREAGFLHKNKEEPSTSASRSRIYKMILINRKGLFNFFSGK